MRAWRTHPAAIIVALALMAWCSNAAADGRPSGLELLKRYPEFVTLAQVTDMTRGGMVADITLCRHKTGNCERFESDAKATDDLADYVYLFAVYKGKYAPQKPNLSKTLAAELLQDAQDTGNGKVLLDYYSGKTACTGNQDVLRCALHSLYKSIGIRRFIIERGDAGGVNVLTADEDGIGDPFMS